jgi:hypothetical protein
MVLIFIFPLPTALYFTGDLRVCLISAGDFPPKFPIPLNLIEGIFFPDSNSDPVRIGCTILRYPINNLLSAFSPPPPPGRPPPIPVPTFGLDELLDELELEDDDELELEELDRLELELLDRLELLDEDPELELDELERLGELLDELDRLERDGTLKDAKDILLIETILDNELGLDTLDLEFELGCFVSLVEVENGLVKPLTEIFLTRFAPILASTTGVICGSCNRIVFSPLPVSACVDTAKGL